MQFVASFQEGHWTHLSTCQVRCVGVEIRNLKLEIRGMAGDLRISIFEFRHIAAFRSRKALVMTETELKVMAAAASIGLNRQPSRG